MRLQLLVALAGCWFCAAQEKSPGLRYRGREVSVVDRGAVKVCVEGPPAQQCYEAPRDYAREPRVELIAVTAKDSALFFRVEAEGTSGFSIHLALLRLDGEGKLENLLPSEFSLSNLSQHAYWQDVAVSEFRVFVTANYVFGVDERHYGKHRYRISASVLKWSKDHLYWMYHLDDEYLTARFYDVNDRGNVLDAERQEILTRLRRVRKVLQ